MTPPTPAVLFDIDGTLADVGHRVHLIDPEREGGKDWDAFLDRMVDNTPIGEIVRMARALCPVKNRVSPEVLFVTARRVTHRSQTVEWLHRHIAPSLGPEWYDSRLHMRGKTDRRSDHEVKASLLRKIRAAGYDPILAVEDSQRVATMYRDEGICTYLVSAGSRPVKNRRGEV